MAKAKRWSFSLKDAPGIEKVHVHKSNKGVFRYTVYRTGQDNGEQFHIGKQALSIDRIRRLLLLNVTEDTLVPELVEIIKLQEPVTPNRELKQIKYSL